MLTTVRSQLRRTKRWLHFMYYRARLRPHVTWDSLGGRRYLEAQLKRTLPKRRAPLQARTVVLVDRLDAVRGLQGQRVLAVGCRNAAELDFIASKGAEAVTGIDLFSADSRILVMDMHQMEFADEAFDVLYSSHSLEHAQDVRQAAKEFVRVTKDGGTMAIEMPVRFEPTEADLVDVGDLEGLLALFEGNVDQMLWRDQQAPFSADNPGHSAVVRCVFTIRK